MSFSVHEMHRRRGRRHFRPGPQNRTSWSGEFNKHLTNWISLPPLCLSVRVTEYNPVEAQINPTLGNRAAQTNGQPCAEKSGTQTEAPAFSHPTRWRLLTDLFLALTDWILRFCKSDVISNINFLFFSSVSQESWWRHCQGHRWLEGPEDHREADHPEQTGSGTYHDQTHRLICNMN